MENQMEMNKMEHAKKHLWSMLNVFAGTKKNNDAILFVATLLYLKKQNALYYAIKEGNDVDKNDFSQLHIFPVEHISFDKIVIENETNKELKLLLKRTISEFQDYFKGSFSPITDFAHVLVDYVFSDDELLDIFNSAVKNIPVRLGDCFLPHEFSDLVGYLLDKESKKILDPFGGRMDFATTLKEKKFVSFERNKRTWELGLFRLAIAGIIEQTTYVYVDDWIGDIDYTFDAIVTMPPFGATSFTGELLDEWALNRFDKLTNEQGQLITIVPMSILSRGGKTQELRKTFSKNNWLESVVCLPSNLFLPTTGIATAVIVLRKNRKEDDKIRFVDASDCFTTNKNRRNVVDLERIVSRYTNCENLISADEILKNNSSWDLRWYVEQKKNVFNEGYIVVKVSDVMTQLPTVSRFEDELGYVVNVGDLSGDVVNYEKRPEMFTKGDNLERTSKVVEPVILLSMIRSPKPTYCVASESNPIFIKNDVVAYRIADSSVHPGYLCLELSKRLKAFTGAVIPRLSKYQILNTLIEFPSLDEQRSFVEQKNLFEEVSLTLGINKEVEERFQTLLEKKKQEYIEEVRNRKHDMKTPMTQLRNTLKLFESLSRQITGEPAEKLKLYVQRQKRALDTLSIIVSHIADEEVFATPEPIDLGEVLSSCQTTTDKYVVAYYPDEVVLKEAGLVKPMVMMGRSDLLRLVQNIIGNAIVRGFVEDYHEYSLNISLTLKNGFYIIDFSNNGRPLPEGMTKERYGMKGVKGKGSNGEGKGGYIVKSITEHYGGDYDIYSQQFAGMWVTHVIVKLPIFQNNE